MKTNFPKKSLSRDDLTALSRSYHDRLFAKHAPNAFVRHIAQFRTDSERQLVFRCFSVPVYLLLLFKDAAKSPKRQFWRMPEFSLVIAHSRMLKEMSAWGQNPCLGWWPSDTAEEGAEWWMKRFDSHQRAVANAFRLWVKRKCPDCSHDDSALATAAFFGLMQRATVSGLPDAAIAKILPLFKRREKVGSRESEFFHKNALPTTEPRWDFPDIDLWLIEVWPLVREYGWTYRDVLDLMVEKFGDDDVYGDAPILDNKHNYLKKRCKELGLVLSDDGKETRGRPSHHDDAQPGLKTFCERLNRQLPKDDNHPDAANLARDAQLHQQLAKMAVNLDPFTRLLADKSKEIFRVQLPPTLKK